MVKIFIDPGHGGSDPGAIGNGLQEKTLTLTISKKIESLLNEYEGVSIRMSRTGDTPLSLSQRTNAANTWGADFFLSVHINAGGGTGYEDYRYNTLSVSSPAGSIQTAIHNAVMANIQPFGVNDRGAKAANFHVLRETNMSAVLSENLFLDTIGDANLLKREDFLNAIAAGHAEGIASAFGLRKKAIAPPPSNQISANPLSPSIVYEAHVQGIGWQGGRRDGQTAGTIGESKRLEALTVKLENSPASLEMQAHIENVGWTAVRTNGEVMGTVGASLRFEAISLDVKGLNVQYRVHIQDIGWTEWVSNGNISGTIGQSKRIEAIEIKLV